MQGTRQCLLRMLYTHGIPFIQECKDIIPKIIFPAVLVGTKLATVWTSYFQCHVICHFSIIDLSTSNLASIYSPLTVHSIINGVRRGRWYRVQESSQLPFFSQETVTNVKHVRVAVIPSKERAFFFPRKSQLERPYVLFYSKMKATRCVQPRLNSWIKSGRVYVAEQKEVFGLKMKF